MPYKLPGGLVIIIIGTIVGWLTGYMKTQPLIEALRSFHIYFPTLNVKELTRVFKEFVPFLFSAIPMIIYNFTEAMNNTESAAAACDKYNVAEICIVNGIGNLAGSVLGSPFPTAVYIGHPGWKAVGGRIGYSLATGIAIAIFCLFGILPLSLNIIPLVCVLPILLYIGTLIGAQAFKVSPLKHAPAIVLALIPNFTQWGRGLVYSALSAANIKVSQIGYSTLDTAGVVYKGLEILGNGAILIGLIWVATAVFAIENNWLAAIIYSLLGAGLSFFGIICASSIGFAVAWQPAISYLIFAILFLLLRL